MRRFNADVGEWQGKPARKLRWSLRCCAVAACLSAIAAASLAGCGGRIARPVAVSVPIDTQLSCDHLIAEHAVNRRKIEDITGEKLGKTDDNIGWILLMPLLVDLSGSEQAEIDALVARNHRLVELAEQKGCAPILPVLTEDGDMQPSAGDDL